MSNNIGILFDFPIGVLFIAEVVCFISNKFKQYFQISKSLNGLFNGAFKILQTIEIQMDSSSHFAIKIA